MTVTIVKPHIRPKLAGPVMESVTQKAIAMAGGVCEVARAFKISAQAVSQWRVIPPERVIFMERISGVSRYELRPDIFGPAPGAPAASASDEPRSEPKREACA